MLQPHQFADVAANTVKVMRNQRGLYNGRSAVDMGRGTGRAESDWGQGTGRAVQADATSRWFEGEDTYLGSV